MVALLTLAPFSSPAHAQPHGFVGEAARQAAPAATTPLQPPGPGGPARAALAPRGAVAPVRQAAPTSAAPRQPTPPGSAAAAPAQRSAPAPAADQRNAPAPHWLAQINAARASAGLLPVVEEPEWSAGSVLHSRYMVKNNYVGHDEETNNAWYTPEGRAAGQNGNAYANYAHDESDPPGIDAWLTTPFHLVNVLDPRLARTGFGAYREATVDPKQDADPDEYWVGATLDVARGLDREREHALYPVFFPGNGQKMPYSRYFGAEHPDPLTSCPDRAFQGAPLLVQLASTPNVTSVTLVKDGLRLDRCVFDETSYKHDDAETQALGREVLAGRHAVVIMPREPLTAGIYRVTLVVDGVTHSWAFAGPEHRRRAALRRAGRRRAAVRRLVERAARPDARRRPDRADLIGLGGPGTVDPFDVGDAPGVVLVGIGRGPALHLGGVGIGLDDGLGFVSVRARLGGLVVLGSGPVVGPGPIPRGRLLATPGRRHRHRPRERRSPPDARLGPRRQQRATPAPLRALGRAPGERRDRAERLPRADRRAGNRDAPARDHPGRVRGQPRCARPGDAGAVHHHR